MHLFHNIFFTMLLIFSDYAAEIWNVPRVTKLVLIDLCVRKAKFRHTYHSWSVSFFFRLKRVEEHHSSLLTFAGSLHTHKVTAPGEEGTRALRALFQPPPPPSPPLFSSVFFLLFFWSQSARHHHTDSFLHFRELI